MVGWQPWELPVEFPSELDASCGIGRSDGSETAVAQIGVWLEEARMIEHIESLGADLQFLVFADRDVLHQGNVHVDPAHGTQETNGSVAEPVSWAYRG